MGGGEQGEIQGLSRVCEEWIQRMDGCHSMPYRPHLLPATARSLVFSLFVFVSSGDCW